jgi:hypothetical protein
MTDDQFIADYHSLNADSKAFMRKIMERVAGIGVKTYGPWSAVEDKRNMLTEIGHELFDAAVYAGMLAVKQERELADHWNHLVLNDECQDCSVVVAMQPSVLDSMLAALDAHPNIPGQLPVSSSTFDLRDDGTDKLAVHEILPAFDEQPTGEWVSAKAFDVSDVESEVA